MTSVGRKNRLIIDNNKLSVWRNLRLEEKDMLADAEMGDIIMYKLNKKININLSNNENSAMSADKIGLIIKLNMREPGKNIFVLRAGIN